MSDFARRLGGGQHVAIEPCESNKRLAMRLGAGQHVVADCRTAEPQVGGRYLARRLGAGQHLLICKDCEDPGESCRVRFFVRGCGNRPLVGAVVTLTIVHPNNTTATHTLTTDSSGVVGLPRVPVGSTITVTVAEEGFVTYENHFSITCPDPAMGFVGQVNLVPATGFACLNCCARPFPSTIYLTFESGHTINLELVQPDPSDPSFAYWQGCYDVDYTHIRYKYETTHHYVPENSPCYPVSSSGPPALIPVYHSCVPANNWPLPWTFTSYVYKNSKMIITSKETRQMKMAFRVKFDFSTGRCTLMVSQATTGDRFSWPRILRHAPTWGLGTRGTVAGFLNYVGIAAYYDVEFDLDACEEVHSVPPGLPPAGTCLVLLECELTPPPVYVDACWFAIAAFDGIGGPNPTGLAAIIPLEPTCDDSPMLRGKWRYPITTIGPDAQCCRELAGTNDEFKLRLPAWLCEEQSFIVTP